MTVETAIATATVIANSCSSMPTMPFISSKGMNTAIREIEIERMVKPISPAPFKAASSGVSPCLEMVHDVLDHHDRIIDDKAHRDRQRHEREIVERKAEHIHHRKRADNGERNSDSRE